MHEAVITYCLNKKRKLNTEKVCNTPQPAVSCTVLWGPFTFPFAFLLPFASCLLPKFD